MTTTSIDSITQPSSITTDEVLEQMRRGEPVFFIDVRNPQAWSEATTKLPNSLRVPADKLQLHLSEIPHNQTVVTYCT